MTGSYTNTQFYPNKWREKLEKNSPLKYCNLKDISWYHLAHAYKYRREIEFLQLIHADKFADDMLFSAMHVIRDRVRGKSIDYRTVNMKWLRKHKGILKNSTITFCEMRLNSDDDLVLARSFSGIIERVLNYAKNYFINIEQYQGKRAYRYVVCIRQSSVSRTSFISCRT